MKILVHTEKLNSRVQYIFRHIFRRILKLDVDFTAEVSEFISYDGLKLSYGKNALGAEFFIKTHGLLHQTGCEGQEISKQTWDGIPVLFALKGSHLPFDIFAASFYLITRYEEYLPHKEDDHGRYVPDQSCAAEHGFMDLPIVDIWSWKMLQALSAHFETESISYNKMKINLCFEVKNAFKWRERGLLDTTSHLFQHLFKFKLRLLTEQTAVLLKIRKDPFDIYDELLDILKNAGHSRRLKSKQVIFFCHLGDYSPSERGTSWLSRKYRELIKHLGDHAQLGLRFSFLKSSIHAVAQERKRFERITRRPLVNTKIAKSRIAMPTHYRNLVDISSLEDYSMGYPDALGYRAGTSTPFYFYDLDFEVQTPLRIVPYAANSEALLKLEQRQRLLKVKKLLDPIKRFGGEFTCIIKHEHLVGRHKQDLYELITKLLKADIETR